MMVFNTSTFSYLHQNSFQHWKDLFDEKIDLRVRQFKLIAPIRKTTPWEHYWFYHSRVDARLRVSLLASFVLHKSPKTTLTQWWVGNLLLFYWSNICHGVIRVHMNSATCRFCGNILFWRKKKLKNSSNCTFYGLMKIWSNFDHWKVHNYHLVKTFMGRILDLNFSSHIITCIESL
jgi:hypothetical protein